MSKPTNNEILTHSFSNGLVLIGEANHTVQSAALTILVPCGYTRDPHDRLGLSSLLCDMLVRGAGTRDSRQLLDDLEMLGVERGESVGASHISFSAATLAANLEQTLSIYADILRRPHLAADQLNAGQLVCLQEINGINDEPAQRMMVELRYRTYPQPWGRSSHGTEEGVSGSTAADVRSHWDRNFYPNGTIIGVAGDFDWQSLVKSVGALFDDWHSSSAEAVKESTPEHREAHIPHESNQSHIGIAYPCVPYRHPDYLRAWAAVGILSGGMSSRLFTEVREKRGLCYTVSASLQTQRDRARVLCHAGTSSERAQETLDVTFAEIRRLRDGILPNELARLKARIKSGLIMQQESSSARSSAIAREWYHLGRVRSLEEIGRQVDDLSSTMINEYLEQNPPQEFTFATLGPQPLELPREVS